MTIKIENMSAPEVELPVVVEEDHLVEAVLQEIVLEIILKKDFIIDPGITLRNHIIDLENNLKNVIDLGMHHHGPKNLIIIHLGVSFPEIIKIHLIDQEVRVLILDKEETTIVFSVLIVWDMAI